MTSLPSLRSQTAYLERRLSQQIRTYSNILQQEQHTQGWKSQGRHELGVTSNFREGDNESNREEDGMLDRQTLTSLRDKNHKKSWAYLTGMTIKFSTAICQLLPKQASGVSSLAAQMSDKHAWNAGSHSAEMHHASVGVATPCLESQDSGGGRRIKSLRGFRALKQDNLPGLCKTVSKKIFFKVERVARLHWAPAALAEDTGSFPSTPLGWLTGNWNSSSRGSEVLFYPP